MTTKNDEQNTIAKKLCTIKNDNHKFTTKK